MIKTALKPQILSSQRKGFHNGFRVNECWGIRRGSLYALHPSVQLKIILERLMNCTSLSPAVHNDFNAPEFSLLRFRFSTRRVPQILERQIYVRDATVNGTRFIAIEKFKYCVRSQSPCHYIQLHPLASESPHSTLRLFVDISQ